MDKKYLAIPIVVVLFGVFALSQYSPSGPINANGELQYKGQVCVYKNNELVDCNHNILVTTGKTQIQNLLGIGLSAPVTRISVGNGTASQAVEDTTLDSEIADCGLAATTGTYVATGTAGAWNITYQWTVSGCGTTPNEVVNTTGLYNATGSGQLFAETTFTGVTLQNNDKLNVTWGLTVS